MMANERPETPESSLNDDDILPSSSSYLEEPGPARNDANRSPPHYEDDYNYRNVANQSPSSHDENDYNFPEPGLDFYRFNNGPRARHIAPLPYQFLFGNSGLNMFNQQPNIPNIYPHMQEAVPPNPIYQNPYENYQNLNNQWFPDYEEDDSVLQPYVDFYVPNFAPMVRPINPMINPCLFGYQDLNFVNNAFGRYFSETVMIRRVLMMEPEQPYEAPNDGYTDYFQSDCSSKYKANKRPNDSDEEDDRDRKKNRY